MKNEEITAKQIISLLDESAAALDASTAGRLAAARNRAVIRHAERMRTTAESRQSGFASWMNRLLHHHRAVMSAALVCSAVFVAFLLTQQLSEQEMLGQGDAFLLASELPPEAYLDKGFDVWLERTSEQ
ncbi:MAG TPA: DUF3619 family protein [Methylophilaceae bacterium]|nr:DUF3619 family protein [Methylophilaceae bacterium]